METTRQSVVVGFIATVSPDKISAPGNLIEHSKMKLLIKQNKRQHSPNIHKWKHTYLLTFWKQINKSVLFVVFKCRSSVVDCRSPAHCRQSRKSIRKPIRSVDPSRDPQKTLSSEFFTRAFPFVGILTHPVRSHDWLSQQLTWFLVFQLVSRAWSAIRSRIIGAKPWHYPARDNSKIGRGGYRNQELRIRDYIPTAIISRCFVWTAVCPVVACVTTDTATCTATAWPI